jgi:hypothetical protein
MGDYVEMVCRLSEQNIVEALPPQGLQVRHLSQVHEAEVEVEVEARSKNE